LETATHNWKNGCATIKATVHARIYFTECAISNQLFSHPIVTFNKFTMFFFSREIFAIFFPLKRKLNLVNKMAEQGRMRERERNESVEKRGKRLKVQRSQRRG